MSKEQKPEGAETPKLNSVAATLRKLSYSQNLTTEETRQALNVIGDYDVITDPSASDGLYFLALTFGLMAKGPSTDELYGLLLSIKDKSVEIPTDVPPDMITDISGTGGDRVKTFNVGTTASFIIAAAGGYVAKQATRAYTGKSGSANIFQNLGLDVFTNTDIGKIRSCLESIGITAFWSPALSEGLKNRVAFLRKLSSIGLLYLTPWHIVSWIYSPFKMSSRVYGVLDQNYLRPLTELFMHLDYKRVLVVHGADGLDEVSNLGVTRVCEAHGSSIDEYEITPKSLGVKQAEVSDVEVVTPEQSMRDFLNILYGKEKGPKRDLAAINAGAAIYALGMAKTMRDGADLAFTLLERGAAATKLEVFADYYGIADGLKDWKAKIQQ